MSKGSTSSTALLAERAAAVRFDELPVAVVTMAEHCVLDAVGVGLAGASSDPARIAAAVALEDAPQGACSIIGSTSTTNASGAALANGTAIHALDYDDMSVPLCGHPTAPLLPALLALGELQGASGAALIEAFVAGYEVECRLGAAIDPSHYARGFHATATVGTVGAAVGAGRLIGLDPDRLELAIGIAATQAAGLKSMFGTMCKPLHAGRAALAGILAARLARDGFTSAHDALATHQGFASAMADNLDLQLLEAPFGDPWLILGNLFKFHAACYFTHGSINAMLSQRCDGLTSASLERATIQVAPGHLSVCNIVGPTTGLEGKFSLRFAAAVALARGCADETSFTDSVVRDADLVELQRRIDVQPDAALGSYDTIVTLETASGTHRVEENTALPAWQADPAEELPLLQKKFTSLTAPLLGTDGSEQLGRMLLGLHELADLRSLQPLLSGSLITV